MGALFLTLGVLFMLKDCLAHRPNSKSSPMSKVSDLA